MNDYSKINKEIDKINMIYKYKEGCCISFIITDDLEAKEYIQKAISSIDIDTIIDEKIVNYDFSENKDDGIKKFEKLCLEKGNLVLATGIEDYVEYLLESGKLPDRSSFYQRVFNLPRDHFYLKNNVRLILLVNESEMQVFKSDYADDFTSYATMKIDINEILKEDNIQEMDER